MIDNALLKIFTDLLEISNKEETLEGFLSAISEEIKILSNVFWKGKFLILLPPKCSNLGEEYSELQADICSIPSFDKAFKSNFFSLKKQQQLFNYYMAIRGTNSLVAYIVAQCKRPLNENEYHFSDSLALYIQNLLINKENEIKFKKSIKEQDFLNQKLFAQSLEIEQKSIDIEENNKIILRQVAELETAEAELLQYNEKLFLLNKNLDNQRKRIKKNEERLKTILNIMNDGLLITNKQNKVSYANNKAFEILNLSENELIGTDVKTLFYYNENKIQLNNGDTIKYKDKNDRIKYLLLNIALEKNINGKINETIWTFSDITALKLEKEKLSILNKELEESIEKNNSYEAFLEANSDIVFMVDKFGRQMYFNRSIEDIFGYSPDEVIGKSFFNFVPRKELVNYLSKLKEVFVKKEIKVFETYGLHRNRSLIPVEIKGRIIKYKGEYVAIGTIRDITARKKAQQELLESKEKIEIAHKNIMDSLNYAKTLQEALLTSKKLIDSYFKNYFLFYRPKEKVGGDFYYINKVENKIIFAVADCTGHGVPGAFLTVLGITFIHELVIRREAENPGDALNKIRERIKRIFTSFGSKNSNGFDIALCALDIKTNELQYAGAYHPLVIISDGEVHKYNATQNPIGFHYGEVPFKNIVIQLKKNDLIYLYSDGFRDQFGGDRDKKYGNKRFLQLFKDIQALNMKEQENILIKEFESWKKDNEQVDDVTVLGIRV